MPIALSEENNRDIIDSWYAEAKTQTPDTLAAFIQKLVTEYTHDYGTICHAMAASAIASAHAVNSTPQGGITGFQSGAVMWEFVRNWEYRYKNSPLRLIDYSTMLYPQYADSFDTVISASTFEWLREEARKKISEGPELYHPNVYQHLQNIVDGNVPFGYSVRKDVE